MILNFDKSHRVCWVRWHLPFRVPCANIVGRKKSKKKKFFVSLLFFLWKGNLSNFCKFGINHLSFSRPNDCRQDEKKNLCKKSFLSKFLSLILQSLCKQVGEKVNALLMFSNSTNLHSSERSRRKFLSNLLSSEKAKNVKKTQKKKIFIFNFCCHPSSTCIIYVGVCCCVGSRTIGAWGWEMGNPRLKTTKNSKNIFVFFVKYLLWDVWVTYHPLLGFSGHNYSSKFHKPSHNETTLSYPKTQIGHLGG